MPSCRNGKPAQAALSSHSVPDLDPREGSWVVVSRVTGESVLETFSRKVAEAINQEKYEVVTIGQWLARVNARVRLESFLSQEARG